MHGDDCRRAVSPCIATASPSPQHHGASPPSGFRPYVYWNSCIVRTQFALSWLLLTLNEERRWFRYWLKQHRIRNAKKLFNNRYLVHGGIIQLHRYHYQIMMKPWNGWRLATSACLPCVLDFHLILNAKYFFMEHLYANMSRHARESMINTLDLETNKSSSLTFFSSPSLHYWIPPFTLRFPGKLSWIS